MRYIALDLETTGLNPKTDQILSVGMVIEDTNNQEPLDQLPKLHLYVIRNRISGSVAAIAMNKDIIDSLNLYNNIGVVREDVTFVQPNQIIHFICAFLGANGMWRLPVTIAGKNPNFDISFLKELEGYNKIGIGSRILDPTILYTKFSTDWSPPDLRECLERAGIDKRVSHDAIEDSLDVIRLLRAKING